MLRCTTIALLALVLMVVDQRVQVVQGFQGPGIPVYPLIPIGGPPPGPATVHKVAGPSPAPSGPSGPSGPAAPTTSGQKHPGTFVESSGSISSCHSNVDCYGKREPNEWCPLPSGAVYQDKGCWCDKSAGECVIDRLVNGEKQWAYCTEKGISRC